MTLNSGNHGSSSAAKRGLAAGILALGALGALGSLGAGQASAAPALPLTPSIPIPPPSPTESASGSRAAEWPVNDIKIGNRSQFSQPAPPSQQTSNAGRPQTLVFKIGRLATDAK